jgi:hypothetical protein
LGTIQVFARCLDEAGHGALCRIKGPADATPWDSEEGRRRGYQFSLYPVGSGERDFDVTPQVILDPSRRKIHVLAEKNTGDMGGAVGLKHFVCEADSMVCTASPGLFLESQLHFNPALAFIAGDRPENDKIIGFQHGGYGGQLRFFTINPNDSSFQDQGWVKDHMNDESRSVCGDYANIDVTPTVVVTQRSDGGRELHLFARAGHGNPLHLYLTPVEFQKLGSGDGSYIFSCEKFEREGRSRFQVGPRAIIRGGNLIQIFGGNENDPAFLTGDLYLWPGTINQETSRFQFQEDGAVPMTPSRVSTRTIGGMHGLNLSPQESPAVAIDEVDPINGDADVFCPLFAGGFGLGGGTAHVRVRSDGGFSSGYNDANFLSVPAAIKVAGVKHLFGATVEGSDDRLGHKPIQHWIIQTGPDGSSWPRPETIAAGLGVDNHGGGRSGFAAIYVP